MDEGREEATKVDRDKGLAQSSTYRYPDGGVVKNPPANAGDPGKQLMHEWLGRILRKKEKNKQGRYSIVKR